MSAAGLARSWARGAMTSGEEALLDVVQLLERRQEAELSPGARAAIVAVDISQSGRMRRSGTSVADAAGGLAVNPEIDRTCVERWAHELGVLDLWREIAD